MVPKSMALLSVPSAYCAWKPAPALSHFTGRQATAGLMLTVWSSDLTPW